MLNLGSMTADNRAANEDDNYRIPDHLNNYEQPELPSVSRLLRNRIVHWQLRIYHNLNLLAPFEEKWRVLIGPT
jgi:hypothetical protein